MLFAQYCTLCILIFCLCMPPVPADAAGQSTILSGKVVSPVTRATPMPFDAVVDQVLVTPGDPAQEGQALLRYHLQDEAERLLQKEVTLGAGTEDLRGQVLDLDRKLAEALAQRDKTKQLVASGLGSSQALGRLDGDVVSLQQRIQLLRTTIHKQETTFQERLKELSGYFGTPIHEGEPLPQKLVLTSRLTGHVLSVAGGLYPGSQLKTGAAPIVVGLMNPMLIQVQVYEADIGQIKEGDIATVTIPSLKDKAFAAKVTSIAWTSNDMNVSNPSYYTVELTMPNTDMELKPGFKAVVHFGKRQP